MRIALLGILLLAFALRAWRLDFQSLWSDEGISLNRASLPLIAMLEQMPAEHVPGYFVLLRVWILLTGEHDYGLRAFSLFPSVLAVALTWRLAVDMAAGTRPRFSLGAAAALLATASPFLIWYAQEARMYAWLLAMALASTVSLWHLLHAPGARERTMAAVAYAFTTAACVYMHYFGALTPIAQTIFMAGYVAARLASGMRGRDLWRGPAAWVAGSVGALLLFLPWLPRVGLLFSFSGWREEGSIAEIPWRYLQAYAGSSPLVTWLPWALLALAALGALWFLRTQPAGGALLLAWIVVPFACVLLLAARNPDYHERYTIFLAAPLHILIAAGIIALAPAAWRQNTATSRYALLLPATVLALVVALMAHAAWRQATDVTLHKPDFRGAAERIARSEQPGDIVLVDGPNPELVFNHYYKGNAPVVDLRGLEAADGDTVDRRLREATEGAQRAWELLFFHDPASVQVWLATRAWASEATFHNGIRVTLYGLREPETPPVVHNLRIGAENAALRLEQSRIGPAKVHPGDLLQVTTDWYTLSQAPDRKFSLRLTDTTGAVRMAQDYIPQNWFAPTSIWIVDRPARDTRAFLIPDDFPSGSYTVTLRLYDPASGQTEPTPVGEDIVLGSIEVLPDDE